MGALQPPAALACLSPLDLGHSHKRQCRPQPRRVPPSGGSPARSACRAARRRGSAQTANQWLQNGSFTKSVVWEWSAGEPCTGSWVFKASRRSPQPAPGAGGAACPPGGALGPVARAGCDTSRPAAPSHVPSPARPTAPLTRGQGAVSPPGRSQALSLRGGGSAQGHTGDKGPVLGPTGPKAGF